MSRILHCRKGISNPASLCYMISVLHQWYMMPWFRSELLNLKQNNLTQSSLVCKIIELWGALYDDNNESIVDCIPIWENLYGELPEENIELQKDASEFSSDCLNKILKELEANMSADLSVKDILAGLLVNRLSTCGADETGKVIERNERFLSISVPVHILGESIDLRKALFEFVKEETFPYRWPDSSTSPALRTAPLPTTKTTKFRTLPKYLSFHLKRFKFDVTTMRKVKLHSRFEFPEFLDMSPYMSPEQDAAKEEQEQQQKQQRWPSTFYRLSGVIIHKGRSANSGHYYSIIRNRNSSKEAAPESTAGDGGGGDVEEQQEQQEWLLFNDHAVSPFDLRNLKVEAFGGFCAASCSSRSGSSSDGDVDSDVGDGRLRSDSVNERSVDTALNKSHDANEFTAIGNNQSVSESMVDEEQIKEEDGEMAIVASDPAESASETEDGSEYDSDDSGDYSHDSDINYEDTERSAFMLYYDRVD